MEKRRTRAQILRLIKSRRSRITKLEQEIIALNKEQLLMSDSKQWYTEKMENVKLGRWEKQALVGRINWKEKFKDDGTGNNVTVTRSQVITIDGKFDF